MRYRVLGPVTAHRGDDSIELIGLQRALLALLLIDANRVVSTDRIIDELWDDTGKDRQNALWVVVSRLRSALEPDRPKRTDGSILVTRPPGYMLSVDADAVDSLRFQSLVAEGRALIDADPKAASLVLNEALALWRGHAFEEFTYHPFAEAEIARLTELRLATVEDRVGADLRAGRCHDLVAELESLVRQHPERERLAAHFMVALHQSGRQAEALRAFCTYRTYLAEEVGLDPSDEITRLEQLILRDDPALRPPEPPQQATGPVTGLSVRGYELRELIGSGATGNVYAAFQPSVGREVAIKVVRPEMADDPDFIRRFEAEARIVAGLEHPRIVPVYDYWREHGGAYLVMRRFEGGNLRTILDRDDPPTAEASRHIVEQVAGALAAAHERGVIHGDLRPANILIDGDGHAYLADFGLSYDLTTSARGEVEYMAPEQIETGRPSVVSDVYALGALLDRLATESTDPMVREVVERACAPDPAARFDDAGAFLVAYTAVTGHPTDVRIDPTGSNPYRGLEAFQESNAAVFFGRERLIERLLARIGAQGPAGRFVALVGPSGSGKSSVVRAGLVPALRLGAVPGSERWFIATVVPGRHPFASLAEAVQSIAVDPPDDLVGQLRVNGIAPVVKRILADPETQVVLIIDQLEELFVQSDPAEAAEFLAAVAAAVADRRSVVRVVATLRADFYGAPLRHPDFGELMRLGTDAITPLNPSELERAITGPAEHVGVQVAPGVVAAIATDMVGQPTALPLMQFALTELYEQRSSQTITVDDYLELGGLTSALAARADAVLGDLTSAQRADAEHIFLRLVALTDDATDTRRRSRLSELTSSARSDVSAVLEPFVRHRLLSVDHDPVTREPTVEIAHEALLSEWTTLRDWIDGARGDVRLHRRLTVAVSEWVASGRNADYLLAGAHLSVYATWQAHAPVRLTGDEHAFLLASRDRSEAELVVERRRSRRLRRLVAGVAVGLVAALVAGGLAYRQGRRADDAAQRASEAADVAEAQRAIAETQTDAAEEQASIAAAQADVAESQTIAATESALVADLERMRAQAGSEVRTNPPLAALLATEAYGIDASPRSAGAVQRVLTGVGGRLATMVGDGAGYLGRGAISADKSVVAVSNFGSIDVWDLDERSLRLRMNAGVVGFDLSPDGALLAMAEGSERLDIVDVASGVAVGTIEERVCAVRFSPAGDRLGVVAADVQQNNGCGLPGAERRLQIWDIGDPSRPQLEYVNEVDSVWDMWWSPDGADYLSFRDDARIDVRDAMTHEPSWTHAFDLTSGITQGSVASPRGALFRSDGSSVVVGAQFNDNSGSWLFTFDTETGDLVGTPTPSASLVSMSWWNEEETQLVGTLQPSGATVLDLELGAEVQPPPIENQNASSVWVDRNRDRMIVAGFVGIEVSSLDGRSVLERRVGFTPEQLAVQEQSGAQLFGALTADGDRLLVSMIDRSRRAPIVEWDLTTDPPTQIGERPPGFAFANGESTLLFDGTSVRVLDGNHELLGPPADPEPERGQAVIWRASSDGSRHAPLRPTSQVFDIYDGRTGERITEIVGGFDAEEILGGAHSFSADGASMMVSVQTTEGEQWRVFDTETGDTVHVGGGEIWTQPWISGTTIYANLPNSFDIERRDVETLEVVGPPLIGHTLVLNAIEDDLDSDRIVTQATNGTVRVWDRESGEQIGREIAIGRQAAGTGIALARDGDLVGIFLDTEFAVWNYDVESWADLACEIAGRNMTQREWDDFGPQDAEYRVTCPQFPPGD